MTTLAAYTGPTPSTGYVGYINISQFNDDVKITIRPESADGGGTAQLVIPAHAASVVFKEAAAAVIARHIPQGGEALPGERDRLIDRIAQLEARRERMAGALVTAMIPIEAILLSGADAAHCQDVRDALHDAANTARQALEKDASALNPAEILETK